MDALDVDTALTSPDWAGALPLTLFAPVAVLVLVLVAEEATAMAAVFAFDVDEDEAQYSAV